MKIFPAWKPFFVLAPIGMLSVLAVPPAMAQSAPPSSATSCLSQERNSWGGLDIVNRCSAKINYRYQKSLGRKCVRTVCGNAVSGNGRVLIAGTEDPGRIRIAACYAPQKPYGWQGDGQFSCS